jgi:hypothetical protein
MMSLNGARPAIAQLSAILEDTTRALARHCTKTGALYARLVDAQQVACFELAWAAADLLAAECVLDAPARSETESRLALHEPHVLVQDAFRRFAREQVMPLAERIHRDDLTVPEGFVAITDFGRKELRC